MMTDLEQKQYQSMQEFLRCEVPKEIQAVLNRGGVNDRDWAWLQQDNNDDPNDYRPINVLMRADSCLLYPRDAKVLHQSLLVFRKTITILSFVSGGVRLFGLRFDAKLDGFVERDEWCRDPW
jgi:hypothetical protein